MRAIAEPLDGNRVKLSVEVPEEELQEAVELTLGRLVKEARIKGFRPGKVPRRLLEQQLGKKAIRDEVIREALPGYYQTAVDDNELDTIADPEIDIKAGEEEGPLEFEAVVEVRPRVSVAGYQGLEVTVPSPVPSEEQVDEQVDRLRDTFAQLADVDRPAVEGDHVTLSLTASRDGETVDGLSSDDFVYPIGAGGIVEGADEKLLGAEVGSVILLEAEDAPGGPAQLEVTVKEVREKILPEANDDWASEASEFDTLEELRGDLRQRIAVNARNRANHMLRQNAMLALVELVQDEPPISLVDEELRERLHSLDERLKSRKISLQTYLEATGQTEETLLDEQRSLAVGAVRTDLALRALADAEEIEVSEEELDAELGRLAKAAGRTLDDFRRRVQRAGRLAELRSDIRRARAVDWLVEHVGVVDDQGNAVDRALLLEESAVEEGRENGSADGTLDGGTDAATTDEAPPELAEEA
jgi:trigger factor